MDKNLLLILLLVFIIFYTSCYCNYGNQSGGYKSLTYDYSREIMPSLNPYNYKIFDSLKDYIKNLELLTLGLPSETLDKKLLIFYNYNTKNKEFILNIDIYRKLKELKNLPNFNLIDINKIITSDNINKLNYMIIPWIPPFCIPYLYDNTIKDMNIDKFQNFNNDQLLFFTKDQISKLSKEKLSCFKHIELFNDEKIQALTSDNIQGLNFKFVKNELVDKLNRNFIPILTKDQIGDLNSEQVKFLYPNLSIDQKNSLTKEQKKKL